LCARNARHCIHRDHRGATRLEPLHQIGILRRPDEAQQRGAFAQQLRLVHAQFVRLGPEHARVRHDLGAGRAVGIVGELRAFARARFDRHRVTQFDKLPDCLRRGGDALLAGVDFLGNADFHFVALSARILR
jgi:hypothetical protein